jgi:hypothetical protein
MPSSSHRWKWARRRVSPHPNKGHPAGTSRSAPTSEYLPVWWDIMSLNGVPVEDVRNNLREWITG